MASILQPEIQLRTGLWANNEAIQGSFCLGAPSVNYVISNPTVSTDPFASKVNKFAESKILRLATKDNGIYFLFGDVNIPNVTITNGVILPVNGVEYFLVDPATPYLRVLRAAAGADVSVTEIF